MTPTISIDPPPARRSRWPFIAGIAVALVAVSGWLAAGYLATQPAPAVREAQLVRVWDVKVNGSTDARRLSCKEVKP